MQILTQFITDYGLFAMILIIFLEYACFPVSSEIILPFSGAVACATNIPFLVILPVSVIAGLSGTCVCYAFGRFGGNAILDKIMTCFPKTAKSIQSSKEKFEFYGNPAVLFGRMIPLCRTYIAFIAGAAKQPLKQYLTFSAIGITIWNTILIGIGYLLKDNWKLVAGYYNNYKNLIIPILLLSILAVIYVKQLKSQKNKAQ